MTSLSLASFDDYLPQLLSGTASSLDLGPERETIQRPPAFVIGTLPLEISYSLYAETHTGPIRLYTLKDGRMTADGIIIHGETVLFSWQFNHPDYHVRDVVHRHLGGALSLPVRRIETRAVMLSGPGYTVYGHWLIDILPRLWVLRAAGFDLKQMNFIVPFDRPDFAVRLLELFGINEAQLIPYDDKREILEVAELILPTNLRRGSRLDPLMRQVRQFFLESAESALNQASPVEDCPRVFISRQNADPSRTLINRSRIEELAQHAGYKIVAPESLSIVEQIQLFQGADSVVGEYGSGLHNALFAGPGTSICAMRGSSIHPGFIQSSIADICDQSIGYVLGPTDIGAIDQSFEISDGALGGALHCMSLLRSDSRG
ncbi:hypothetical protein FHS31_003073 [Sphingomonas vulcanisoli]|uniref:Glycosyltransferase 61 catalytic domain-containing protein n=1 Tax=Sphingomonas vulcanisoli TaxID=1658060 RepID=A0ABX0TVH2_9SPHN|nr:glycosyltransferase 61 family protein [Sphingomonas vulcanisoli]NIJ09441.1 hypothetical protein [Sphingomonas vulcanisoli]